MTDTDPRLEAAAKAHRETEFPVTLSWDQREARRFIAMHDALRAFDQAQPAEIAERKPLPGKHMSAESAASMAIHDLGRDLSKIPLGVISTAAVTAWRKWEDDNATAPVMGADPPWLNECRDFAWSHTGKKPHATDPEIARAQNAIIRRVLTFANAQPPSDEAIRIGEGAFLEVWPGHLALPPDWRKCVRAALVKARGGA